MKIELKDFQDDAVEQLIKKLNPANAKLFDTRQQARNWCNEKLRKWRAGRHPSDPVLLWKVRPVRVREIVEVEI